MNHKSWVTSRQFPNQNLAGQMVLTTFYCISVLGQTNLIEQLSEGLAKQFIKLDVISGIKQELRPLSVLVFSHAHFQDFMKFRPTNWLLQVGYSWCSTSWMTTWGVLCKLNNSPLPVWLSKSLNMQFFQNNCSPTISRLQMLNWLVLGCEYCLINQWDSMFTNSILEHF